ncbi:Zinc finger AN1 domain-containing stress-associated protein 12 [Acorus gramineus]|uniref:Zinc finger AN1 domain-containing stress-associated protein 12 n=1 Tax=Acorus gramineus TaxID=55184 RepID=A0AAV9BDB7_ACOGR|nr:Zinc finger AN1 domain-containing stress-associated protein 12 [Acorus gramineus]
MGGGTEAFPDLGAHCQHPGCHQLDFLPFTCLACQEVFCLEHRTYTAHNCPKGDRNSRRVAVCEACSMSIEIKDNETEKLVLEKHAKSGVCDPTKKKKPRCPVKNCKEVLTFSNSNTCKVCHKKVCLKHRFPAEHACKKSVPGEEKLLAIMGRIRTITCREDVRRNSSPTTPSAKAC